MSNIVRAFRLNSNIEMIYIQRSEFNFAMHAVPNDAAEWQNVVNDPKLSDV